MSYESLMDMHCLRRVLLLETVQLRELGEIPAVALLSSFPGLLEGFQEGDEVVLVLLGKVEIETRVIEIHGIHQGGCRSIMEIGCPPSHTAEDRPFDFADMVELAVDQRLPKVRRGLAVVCRQTRGRVRLAHRDLRQVAQVKPAQADKWTARAGVASANVQRRREGVVADVRRVMAGAACSLKRWDAARNQAPSCHVVIDAGHTTDRNLQSVEELLTSSDGLPGSNETLIPAPPALSPFAVKIEDIGSELAVAWSRQPAGLLEVWEQEVHAGIHAEEERLRRKCRGSAVRTAHVEQARVVVKQLRGEQIHFEIDDLLLFRGDGSCSVSLRMAGGRVHRLVCEVAQ